MSPTGAPRADRPPAQETGGRGAGARLAANVAGGLCYAAGPLTGLLFLLDRRRFVRFHALQSLGLSAVAVGAGLLLGPARDLLALLPPPLGTLAGLALGGLLLLALGGAWLRLMARAFRGGAWPLPRLGGRLWRALHGRAG